MSEEKTLYQKLHAIMEDVSYIQKDAKNSFHKYTYASEKAIKETLHEALVKHRVLFQLSACGQQVVDGLTLVDFEYAFIDVDSGDKLNGTFVAQGEDKGDKGAYKAITGAIKYILTSTFIIATGDDPENEDSPKQNRRSAPASQRAPASNKTADNPPSNGRITQEQREHLFELSKKHKWNKEQILNLLGRYGYENSAEIEKKDFPNICDDIKGALETTDFGIESDPIPEPYN